MRVGGILWGRRPPPPGGRPPPRAGAPSPWGAPPPKPLSIQKVFDCKWHYHSGTLYRKPVLHPPTPYTLSALLKGREARGEGGLYTQGPCPFGALLVVLSEGFLNGKRNIGGGGPLTGVGAAQKETLYQEMA
jgi:hypothetical protein